VIPGHNEAPSLQALLGELSAALSRTGRSWEIVYVDDGSTDETPALLAALAGQDPHVRAVTLPYRQGKAAALAAGFAATGAETIVTIDADLQDDPADIPRMLATLNGGPRPGVRLEEAAPRRWHRRASSRLFNAVASSCWGRPARSQLGIQGVPARGSRCGRHVRRSASLCDLPGPRSGFSA